MKQTCVLATRKSPLALVQAGLVASCLRDSLGLECRLLPIVTTGDQQADWNLEQKGGKGLFTGELEQSLLRGDADIAVHSTKDLPGGTPDGLAIAGYLPRADPRDVLVTRLGVEHPRTIATGSPRRRLQLTRLFPDATFVEIRGNVDTRLKKIAGGAADATVLAAAGLDRLGIVEWPELHFRRLEPTEMTPAVGQGAVAVQCRASDVGKFSAALDAATELQINVERAFQAALGGGCHIAFGAYALADTLYFFHERTGPRKFPLPPAMLANPIGAAESLLRDLGLL